MKAAIKLREKINSGNLTSGIMATDHLWPRLVEVCENAGLDYLIADREHGPHSDEEVALACQIGRLMDFPVFMRVVDCEYATIRRALDLGPCGILVPCVESVEQLDKIQEAIQMPPRGKRRPGGLGNYWIKDYQYETWKENFERDFIVVIQIESKIGLENCEEIAKHPIVTAMGVGPYDLSADLGCCWDPENPTFKKALERISEAGKQAGKNTWMMGDGPTLQNQGYSFICFSTTEALLSAAIKQQLEGCAKTENKAPETPKTPYG